MSEGFEEGYETLLQEMRKHRLKRIEQALHSLGAELMNVEL